MHETTAQLMKHTSDFLEWDDMSLRAIEKHCCSLEKSENLCNYKLMLSYLQSMLTCDGHYKEALWQGKKGPSDEECACKAGTMTTKFQSWHSQGQCLLYLASAATQMQMDICRPKSSSMEDISGFALAFRCSEHDLLDLAPNAPWFKLSFWDEMSWIMLRLTFFYLPLPSEIWTDLVSALISDPISSYKIAPVHTIKTGFCIPTNYYLFNTEEAPE
ncbi:hypothetical protein IW262DRAFT_1294878 [Armillaria fumosa]|nr:hypothetical protein IW262DRAFT_1294878 [Armillaria fumosa]